MKQKGILSEEEFAASCVEGKKNNMHSRFAVADADVRRRSIENRRIQIRSSIPRRFDDVFRRIGIAEHGTVPDV